MNIYRDGQFVETFEEPRDYDTLVSYISKHARPTGRHTGDKPAEDKKVLESQQITYNPTGTVLPLDETNFQEVISGGHAFIKFFAPWSVLSPIPLSNYRLTSGVLLGVDIANGLHLLGRSLRDK